MKRSRWDNSRAPGYPAQRQSLPGSLIEWSTESSSSDCAPVSADKFVTQITYKYWVVDKKK